MFYVVLSHDFMDCDYYYCKSGKYTHDKSKADLFTEKEAAAVVQHLRYNCVDSYANFSYVSAA